MSRRRARLLSLPLHTSLEEKMSRRRLSKTACEGLHTPFIFKTNQNPHNLHFQNKSKPTQFLNLLFETCSSRFALWHPKAVLKPVAISTHLTCQPRCIQHSLGGTLLCSRKKSTICKYATTRGHANVDQNLLFSPRCRRGHGHTETATLSGRTLSSSICSAFATSMTTAQRKKWHPA